MENLKFPIGKFDSSKEITLEIRERLISEIAELPENLRKAVENLNDLQLDTPYRPDGWTLRQVVHHVADSHLNAFCRFKLALTEDFPTIRPYYEDRWAELADNRLPVEDSLKIVEGVHSRWAELLRSMSTEDFEKRLNHPDTGKWTLSKMLGLYAWHGKHHLEHINSIKGRDES